MHRTKSEETKVEYIEVELTGGNINQGHFYLPGNTKLFPEDAWGGRNKEQKASQVEVYFDGTAETVLTDIDATKRLLREARGESKRFLKFHKLEKEDLIYIHKVNERAFVVSTIPPSKVLTPAKDEKTEDLVTLRKDETVSRIIRDTAIAREIKNLYNYSCQVCGLKIETPSGSYAEGAHIKALGEPHNGPDVKANILCLCPNHHIMFDKACFSINDDYTMNGISGFLTVDSEHNIGIEYLKYHRENA